MAIDYKRTRSGPRGRCCAVGRCHHPLTDTIAFSVVCPSGLK
jgi:hypothetical protein